MKDENSENLGVSNYQKIDLTHPLRVLDVAIKHDAEKPRTDLLVPEFVLGVSEVLAFGAKKYAANNWKKGLSILRLCGSTLRHTFALMSGETIDPESGLKHTYHIGCNAMFIGWMLDNKPEMDDRSK